MKKFIISLSMLFVYIMANAYSPVRVSIIDGIYNQAVKAKMERNASLLLTAINAAKEKNTEPNLSSIGISAEAASDLKNMFGFTPFVCPSSMIAEHCITTRNGYQIRNISLILDTDESSDYDNRQEASISFNKTGDISAFHITISKVQYNDIVSANLELDDFERRMMILDYVEQFRTSYETKDIAFLNQVFSDDALIVTGTVIKQTRRDGVRLPDKINYKKQSKQEYLTNLQKAFKNNKRIRVTFDEVEIMRHPNPNRSYVYGVTVKQGYTSDRYHDDGYVFMYWNFEDEQNPKIMVRTWQPEMFNGKKLNRNDIFSLSDF